MSEFKRIDLIDWYKFGEGSNAIAYRHKSNPTVMLKMDKYCRKDYIVNEFLQAKRVYELGVPSPEMHYMVTDGHSYGYVCERIQGKKSYCRLLAKDPKRIDELAKHFAEQARKLHSIRLEGEPWNNPEYNQEQIAIEMVEKTPYLKSDTKQRLVELVRSIPSTQTFLHGDLSFGNLITTGEKDYWIDLGDVKYGNIAYDLSKFHYNLNLFKGGFIARYTFHNSKKRCLQFYDKVILYYFENDAEREEYKRNASKLDVVRDAILLRSRFAVWLLLPRIQQYFGDKPTSRWALFFKLFGKTRPMY
ncbi:MAG: phosphotransferase [Bacteroidales bacterium]|nr:phosphotransferase [Candidatus Colimorpha onthohippi]